MDIGHMPTLRPPASRRRHLLLVGAALLVLLAAYAATLAWVTHKLETDVQKSIHPVPALLAGDSASR